MLGLITTTTPRTLAMMRRALVDAIDFDAFHLITSKADVRQEKPHPEIYEMAMQRLGVSAADAIAFEDTPASQSAATGAGLICHLYAGEYAVTTDAMQVTDNPAATLATAIAASDAAAHHAAAE